MSAQPNLLQVQLSQLQLSPLNARKTGGTDIEGLAASIEAHGLLQNLSVASANDGEAYQVIAGGRRLAALQLLQREGRLAHNYLVPVRIINEDSVLEASTAENTLREAMHPADQFDAFRGMVDAGKSIPDVAAHFGVAEVVVKQRLKLARVAPSLVQLYREDAIELDQLQALAISDDHALQERVWESAKKNYGTHAYALRRTLTQGGVEIGSGLVKFVGVDAYEAAGGKITRDLFSARDEAYLDDRVLLESLAMDKLEASAQAERDAGWSWAEARISCDYGELDSYPHSGAQPKERKPTVGEGARIAAINARLAEIERLQEADQDAHDDDDPNCLDDDTRQQLDDESEALEEERSQLAVRTEVWPATVMATAGVVVYLDHGGVRTVRGRLQPGQKAGANGTVTGTPTNSTAEKPAPAKKPELSLDMVLRLEMHRAAAIRTSLAENPEQAFTLLLTHLVLRLLSTSASDVGLGINATNQHTGCQNGGPGKFEDLGKAQARKVLDHKIAQWKKDGLPSKAADVIGWVEKLTAAERLELLALCVALTVETNPGARGQALASRLHVDMANWWQPTADTYLSIVPKALLAQAVADVAGKPAGEAILALKKDAAIAETAKKLAGTGWLPKPLRGAEYSLTKPGAKNAAPAKKATAKKPAAKKAAAKKAAKAGTKPPEKTR